MWDLIVSVPDHCLSFYLVIFFHAVIHAHVYSPGARTDNPLEHNFDISINLLSLWSFVLHSVSLFH